MKETIRMSHLDVTEEAAQHGQAIVFKWKHEHPTYKDAREMLEILRRETQRLTDTLVKNGFEP